MTRWLSLQARLLVIALATTVTIVGLTAWATKAYVATLMATMLNTKLDAQVEAFADRLARDPATPPERSAFLVEFSQRQPRYGWRVVRGANVANGGARFGQVTADLSDPQEHEGIVSGAAEAANGEVLHVRRRAAKDILIEVGATASIIAESTATTMRNLLIAIGGLGLAMGCAAWLQLRATLLPVRQLRDAIIAIRSGDRSRVPEDQPVELLPLATEVNALLAQNQTGLASARKHVARRIRR